MSDFAALAGDSGLSSDPQDWIGEGIESGSVSYVRLPAVQQLIASDKDWIALDPTSLDTRLPGLDNSAPGNAFYELLRAASDDGDSLGGKKIRGVRTTGFRLRIDPGRVADVVPEASFKVLQPYLERRRRAGIGRMELEVWLDDEGRVRHMAEHLEIDRDGTEGTLTYAIEFFDFGTAVDVKLPPAGDVISSEEFAKLLQGGDG